MCSVYGKDPVSIRTYQKNGLKIFDWEFLSVNDWSRPGRPTEIDTDKIKVLVDENSKNDINDDKKKNVLVRTGGNITRTIHN